MKHKFNYNWTLKDANFTKDKGKVFSCFACGGGSKVARNVLFTNKMLPKMQKIEKRSKRASCYL